MNKYVVDTIPFDDQGPDWEGLMTRAGIMTPNPTVTGEPGSGWALVVDGDLIDEKQLGMAIQYLVSMFNMTPQEIEEGVARLRELEELQKQVEKN